MKRFVLATALLAGFCATPALAQQTKVGDWTIEKRSQDTHCNASRGYKDADDDNREYAIVLTYSDKAIVFVIIYDGWEWEKTGQILHADFSTDDNDNGACESPAPLREWFCEFSAMPPSQSRSH